MADPSSASGALLIRMDEHPLARVAAFSCAWPRPLGEMRTPAEVVAQLRPSDDPPVGAPDSLRQAIRGMLRQGGYKPSGRGKPASEYLVRAAEEGALASINPAVDVCNAISLRTGFPISVVDLDRSSAPFAIRISPPGSTYIFNASGQEIALGGLLCLIDSQGPCANAVRDSQRTKTDASTMSTLSIVWGAAGFERELEDAVSICREMLSRPGTRTVGVDIETVSGGGEGSTSNDSG